MLDALHCDVDVENYPRVMYETEREKEPKPEQRQQDESPQDREQTLEQRERQETGLETMHVEFRGDERSRIEGHI